MMSIFRSRASRTSAFTTDGVGLRCGCGDGTNSSPSSPIRRFSGPGRPRRYLVTQLLHGSCEFDGVELAAADPQIMGVNKDSHAVASTVQALPIDRVP